MIVSRLTFFTKTFVICCYQVTNFFARGTGLPVRFLQRPLVFVVLIAYFAVPVLGEVCHNTGFARCHFPWGFPMRWFTKRCLQVHRLMLKASSSTKCSVNSSNRSGRTCDRLPSAASMFSFLFLFSVSEDKQQVSQCSTACTLTLYGCWARRRIFYCKILRHRWVGTSGWKSRNNDGHVSSVFHCILQLCKKKKAVVFDHWSIHRSIRDLRRVFQATENCWRILEDLYCHEKNPNLGCTLLLPRLSALLHWLW